MNPIFKSESGLAKYVQVNGEYRFCNKETKHSSLVTDKEKPISAGFIYWNTDKSGKYIRICDEHSSTLNYLGPSDEDGVNISKLLNFNLKPSISGVNDED